VPPGLAGVILTLWLTNTTLNVMSLMGVVMFSGNRGIEQHFDRRVHAAFAGARAD